MISKLPKLMADRIANAVNEIVTQMDGSGNCAGLIGEPANPLPDNAQIYAALGTLTQSSNIGARSKGEIIKTLFEANVIIHLLGHETDETFPSRDLMLSIILDKLSFAPEPADPQTAPVDTAQTQGGERILKASWRFSGLKEIRPTQIEGRAGWRLDTMFTGSQTLSPAPADGGVIKATVLNAISEESIIARRLAKQEG